MDIAVVTIIYPKEMLADGCNACFRGYFHSAILQNPATVFEPSPSHLTESYRFEGPVALDHAWRFHGEVATHLKLHQLSGEPAPYIVTRRVPYMPLESETCKGFTYFPISGIVGQTMEEGTPRSYITEGTQLEGAAKEAALKKRTEGVQSNQLDLSRSIGRHEGQESGKAWMASTPQSIAVQAILKASAGALSEVLAQMGIVAPTNVFPGDPDGSLLFELGWCDGFRLSVLRASGQTESP